MEVTQIDEVQRRTWQENPILSNLSRNDEHEMQRHTVTYLHLEFPDELLDTLWKQTVNADRRAGWSRTQGVALQPRCIELITYTGVGSLKQSKASFGWHKDSG